MAVKTTKLADMVAVKLAELQVLEHLVVKLLQVDILESVVILPMMVEPVAVDGMVLIQPVVKQLQLPVAVEVTHLALLEDLVTFILLLQPLITRQVVY